MRNVKNAPNQPFIETKDRFEWEDDETLVDRRNRLPARISRVIRTWWFWTALLALVVVALLDADVMRTILSALGLLLTLSFAIVFIVIQFVAMFWFVSRTRQYTVMPGAEGIGFDDYKGQPEILEQARQIVTLLRGVKAFEGAGGEPLNGLLLEGPPGTGKTWLAQAISTEAGVPFYYVDTSSLQGSFMGVGNMKVANMYSKARKAANEYGAAVIFLDEIDSIGARGGVSSVGGGRSGEGGGMAMGGGMGLLSTMLIEMSGFSLEHGWRVRLKRRLYRTFLRRDPPKPQKRVLTIGATNRIQALDPALLRPGRFDKKIRIDAPDGQGRRDIFEYYLGKMARDESLNPTVLASETPGYTPADIKYLLNETLRYALFDGRRFMTYTDFQRAKPEHEMGLRSPLKHMSREARERLAYYYAGRATAIRLYMPNYRIARITIIRQGAAFGHVAYYPANEAYQGMMKRDQYFHYLRALLAGKAAEAEFCGLDQQSLNVVQRKSYNGRSDLGEVRRLLMMLAQAGILGPLGANAGLRYTMMGEQAKMPADMAVAVEETYQKLIVETRRALRDNAHIVKALAALLMEKEELLADDVAAFFDQFGLHTPTPSLLSEPEMANLLPAPDDAAGAAEPAEAGIE